MARMFRAGCREAGGSWRLFCIKAWQGRGRFGRVRALSAIRLTLPEFHHSRAPRYLMPILALSSSNCLLAIHKETLIVNLIIYRIECINKSTLA